MGLFIGKREFKENTMADFSGLQNFASQGTEQLPLYQYLSTLLQGGASGGIPYKGNLLQTSTGAINKQYNTASNKLSDTMSAKGLGKSGIGIAAQSNLAGEQSGALNQATANINQEDINYRNQMISNLLGLNASEGGYEGQQKQQKLSALSQLLGGQLEEDKMDDTSDIFESLLSAVGRLGSAALPLLLGKKQSTDTNAGSSVHPPV
jgi:hypothetical protein